MRFVSYGLRFCVAYGFGVALFLLALTPGRTSILTPFRGLDQPLSASESCIDKKDHNCLAASFEAWIANHHPR